MSSEFRSGNHPLPNLPLERGGTQGFFPLQGKGKGGGRAVQMSIQLWTD